MLVQAYIHTAKALLESYRGEEPFSSYLKKFFSANKKYGSRDRKQISHVCYCFFRLGKSLLSIPIEERIAVGLFLCSDLNNQVLKVLRPEWDQYLLSSLEEKIAVVQQSYPFQPESIFTFEEEVSGEIDYSSFSKGHLVQPLTYLRLRPSYEQSVADKLEKANIPFRVVQQNSLSIPPATKLDDVLYLDKEAVVQDLSSQQVLQPLLQHIGADFHQKLSVWDCCSASGGKSILVHDHFPKAALTVSDVRESILVNLKKRFKRAGIYHYQSFVADLTKAPTLPRQTYDLIICDAPCTGSGTWSRTPEQLYFFKKEKIGYYAALQKQIAAEASKFLKPGGLFLYITCSVFKEENEQVVEHLKKNSSLEPKELSYFKGYHQQADTLFSSLLIKS